MDPLFFVGVDGCAQGAWAVSILHGSDGFDALFLCDDFPGMLERAVGAALVLVDVPIGLLEGGREPRACDQQARGFLRGRRGGPSSVFSPPSRNALNGNRVDASALNFAATGRKLSQQSLGILPRIADVDRILQAQPDLQTWCRESHPEVCFTALNDWQPMMHTKKTTPGIEERLDLLMRLVPDARTTYDAALQQHRRSQVAKDDVIDAMVLAVAAREAYRFGVPTIPSHPPRDGRGLRMEMVCPVPPPQ